MEPQVKLEVLEAQAEVKLEVLEALAEYDTRHAGPPHAHDDAASSLAGLALPGPGLGTPAVAAAAAAPAAAPKRSREVRPRKSGFVGVSWNQRDQQWTA